MTEFRPFTRQPFRGEVHPDYHDQLEDLLGRLANPNREKVLKEGRARVLWVEESSTDALCFKEYHLAKTGDRLLRFFRGSRARREWVRLQRLFQNSVSIPTPVLWAETHNSGGWVVTRYEPNTVSLSEALESKRDFSPAGRRTLANQLGIALASMHRAGVRHDDLHAGNILVRMDRDNPEVFILDLHQVALKRRLSWETRLRNLGRLLGSLQKDAIAPSWRQRCLRSYLETRTDWNPPFEVEREARRSMGDAIEKFARLDFEKRWRKRVDKCQEHGKRFHRFSAEGYTGWIRSEWDRPEILTGLKDPNSWIDSDLCQIVKHTPTTTVARGRVTDDAPPLFIKRYNRKDLWERTKNLFRMSRSMKVWRSGYALELLGISTPKTICAIEKRIGPILLEAFVITEWVEDGVGFDDFYRERCCPDSERPLTPESRDSLEREVASLFRSLHRRRISHGDLKGRNILLDPNAPAPFDPRFVDLDAMSLRPIRFRRERINDLSRLLFSVYPIPSLYRRIRFFKEYAKFNPSLWKDRRTWWMDIERRTSRKLREKGLI